MLLLEFEDYYYYLGFYYCSNYSIWFISSRVSIVYTSTCFNLCLIL